MKPRSRKSLQKVELSESKDEDPDIDRSLPTTILRKIRQGRMQLKNLCDPLERTFASIRQQNSEVLENKENVFKDRVDDDVDTETSDDDNKDNDGLDNEVVKVKRKRKMMAQKDDPNWPLDADVGWGVSASKYFEQHPIGNVAGKMAWRLTGKAKLMIIG